MPRPTSRGERGFIWIPREDPLIWKIYVNDIEVTTDILNASFTKSVLPDISFCNIELINSDEIYSSLFSQGQTITLKSDFTDGTTVRFNGTIDAIEKRYDNLYILKIAGSHVSQKLFDLTINKSYTGATSVEDILTELVSIYLSGYGYTLDFTSTSTITPIVSWDNRFFADALTDLCKLSEADAYVDDDKVIHFFNKGSVYNNDEAIVWNDTLIRLGNFGMQTITTKNKSIIYGDDGNGLPVIYIAEDKTSQSSYGIKEIPIWNKQIQTISYAALVGEANLGANAIPEEEGTTECFNLPSLQPGQLIWITNPPIIDPPQQVKIWKFTHNFPSERSNLIIGKERKLNQIIKATNEKEIANREIVNPYAMIGSINLVFSDATSLVTRDSNVEISNGVIFLSSGSQGTFTSITHELPENITAVHLKVAGSAIFNTLFELSTDSGSTYQTLILDQMNTITSTGKSIILKTTMQNSNTEIKSIAVLYK